MSGNFVHNLDGARPEVLLALPFFQDEDRVDHLAVRYSVAVFTMASLRNQDGYGGGRIFVECAAGCFGMATWDVRDTTYLGLMQRAWADCHLLPVHAGPDLPDEREQGLGSDLGLGEVV